MGEREGGRERMSRCKRERRGKRGVGETGKVVFLVLSLDGGAATI